MSDFEPIQQKYEEAIQYLFTKLPIYQRIGAPAYKADLKNITALCEVLGNPQKKFQTIHVAGTNGKGSTAHALTAILICAGYKTGLYTSPHLKDFSERIRVNGLVVSKSFVIDFVEKIKSSIDTLSPSFFEITVAMAFEYFAQQSVDIAVVEVGLGGRLDATNIIFPILSVITNIGYDHQYFLGDTLEKIAHEKAGIIKVGVPVVISERQKEVEQVFLSKAKDLQAPIEFADDQYQVKRKSVNGYLCFHQGKTFELRSDLTGNYQLKNMGGVMMAVNILRKMGWLISDDHIKSGFRQVCQLTGLKGRWQTLSTNPLVICDTAHNAEGIRFVVEQLNQLEYDQLHVVWGMVSDKDIVPILSLLPKEAQYYFCAAQIPRALDAEQLAQKALEVGLKGIVIKDVKEALVGASQSASVNDVIFVGGSTFVVAELDLYER